MAGFGDFWRGVTGFGRTNIRPTGGTISVRDGDVPQDSTFLEEASSPQNKPPTVGMTDDEMQAKGFRLEPTEGSHQEKKV